VAEEGFKRKLTAIVSADGEGYSRLMHGPEKPTSHGLTLHSTSKTDLARQSWFSEFYWETGCDEKRYLINFLLNP